MTTYDYIICGAGCGGLSLVYHILQKENLQHKKILILDKEPVGKSSKAWRFWKKESILLEPIISKTFSELEFKTTKHIFSVNISPYTYNVVLSNEFYDFILAEIKKKNTIDFVQEEVKEIIQKNDNAALVKTTENIYCAEYVFTSIPSYSVKPYEHYLIQHFKGWIIETSEPTFNSNKVTWMDYDIPQYGETRFVYTLPFSETKALVEYTIFSENILPEDKYDLELEKYIQDKISKNYTILETEFGAIPMTNTAFISNPLSNIIPIGIAGGCAKPSTGYTFMNIQRMSKKIATQLANHKKVSIEKDVSKKRYEIYDSALLQVLKNNKLPAEDIFAALFSKAKASEILAFLDEEGNPFTEYIMINKLPITTFCPAAIKELFLKITR